MKLPKLCWRTPCGWKVCAVISPPMPVVLFWCGRFDGSGAALPWSGREVLTQWDKDDVEAMGFQIDVLGSRNLTIIHDTLAAAAARHGGAATVEDIPTADGETLPC